MKYLRFFRIHESPKTKILLPHLYKKDKEKIHVDFWDM